jgi:hypothetical protein
LTVKIDKNKTTNKSVLIKPWEQKAELHGNRKQNYMGTESRTTYTRNAYLFFKY